MWRWREQRAQRAAQREMPEAVALLANGLSAGLPLPQALQFVAAEGPIAVRAAFGRVTAELALGRPIDGALAALRAAIGGDDVHQLLFALGALREAGGNLIGVLQQLAATMRERARVRGRVAVMVTQGMVSGFVIAGLPLCLLAALGQLAPEWVTPLWTTPLGRLFLGAGVVLETVGLWWIARIVRVEI